MAIQQKVTFVVDGKEFPTELDALAHDKAKETAHLVDDYLGAQETKAAPAGLLRKELPKFLVHIEREFGYKLVKVEKAEDTAETDADAATQA